MCWIEFPVGLLSLEGMGVVISDWGLGIGYILGNKRRGDTCVMSALEDLVRVNVIHPRSKGHGNNSRRKDTE